MAWTSTVETPLAHIRVGSGVWPGRSGEMVSVAAYNGTVSRTFRIYLDVNDHGMYWTDGTMTETRSDWWGTS